MTRALIGLGGNIGDPATAMAQALRWLDARDDAEVVSVSRLYRTPPWGKTDQPDFLNAVAAIETSLAPWPLLEVCLGVERELKRERRERWGPRPIDLDILDHGGLAYHDDALTLPHPRMAERAFVLVPLADVDAGFGIGGRTVSTLLSGLDRAGIEPATADGSWWR
ncbi:2-amino-4-hydroxy-6-hydroxymethyldihydropteridine diphosphokinase [Aureimonas leprariae]|uniref:2-amino-4-hydroxy-6-hydroxymethyldihydropteridine pyrophosphokinase n=1 Tax=Plantimonas leprariae TaxID=2615207 RepID=A0A7V7PR11_9HYPH|nr:2-amino-4-hydroxy-6-hydroxymethyldihydropteridine diphosphokinase [Aureimonas leprariae]KAB0680849.1 2-amino-4-hydroxy-6-hydroxymethyldihydropteridine diphosphokinase [Aureimonas leprariae]